MSETRHTSEPWITQHDGEEWGIFRAGSCHFVTTVTGVVGTEANAHRIVACVNALAGVDDPAAELARLRRVEEAARALWAASPDRVRVEHWDALDSALGDGS